MRARSTPFLAMTLGFACTAAYAAAQAPAGYYPASSRTEPVNGHPATRYEQTTGRNNPALAFYGGSKAMAYASQNRTPAPAPLPVQTGRIAKPFSGVQQAGGVSPYLALDARESETSLPNYYMFVRPQIEQQQMFQVQQAQYRRLQQQVRTASSGGAVANPNGGIPTTGHSAQFMNVGGYYPGLK